jgi:hypothetical protein
LFGLISADEKKKKKIWRGDKQGIVEDSGKQKYCDPGGYGNNTNLCSLFIFIPTDLFINIIKIGQGRM